MKTVTLEDQINYVNNEVQERTETLREGTAMSCFSSKEIAERRKDLRIYKGILSSLKELKNLQGRKGG